MIRIFTHFLWKVLLHYISNDSALRGVVRRQLNIYPVPGKNPDSPHPHFSRDVREHFQATVDLDLEHCVREVLDNGALDPDDVVFLCHEKLITSIGFRRPAENGTC